MEQVAQKNIPLQENSLTSFAAAYFKHDSDARKRINLTPSENTLSPLAKLPFLLDAHARYFLDDQRIFGYWAFPGGKDLGAFEHEQLLPVLNELAKAQYTNVRAISGINCMTIAFAAWTEPGDTIFSIPVSAGGHPSTALVAKRLGLKLKEIPFLNPFDIDFDKFEQQLKLDQPSLIYIDQGSLLFAVDPLPLKEIVDRVKPDTLIHYDSSHINGLILGQAIFNPLERGADTFGGSTHKTLPGPHKGFIATNEKDLCDRYQTAADHFVSHHHMASVMSLAITLHEMKHYGGIEYAANIIKYTKLFAEALDKEGYFVAAKERGFTACHQIWAHPADTSLTEMAHERMLKAGMNINKFGGHPGVPNTVYRLSVAEFIKRGAMEEHIYKLANIFSFALDKNFNQCDLDLQVSNLYQELPGVAYCCTDWKMLRLPSEIKALLDQVYAL